jgi:hypothetical protein
MGMFGILLSCLCFASYKYSHHSIIIATSFGHTFSATTSFQFVSGRVCIMAITRAGAITVAAKAVSKSRDYEKRRKSAARTHKWRERQSEEQQSEIRQTNRTGHAEGRACLSEERQSEIRQTDRTGHAEWRACLSEERRSEIRQTDRTGHAEGHACLSEERQSEIRQTNRTGHAEGRACLSAERRSEIRQIDRTGHAEVFAHLSEERHAERRAHHDMDVADEEKDSCDNCHRRDVSVDPRYKLTFTVVSNEEIRTCKLAKVKPRQVHDEVIYFTLCLVRI